MTIEPSDPAPPQLVAHWKLNGAQEFAHDSVGNIRDAIHSRQAKHEWVDGLNGKALRLDGYSVWITRNGGEVPELSDGFTVELWTALETYPVSDGAFVNRHWGPSAGWFFGLNSVGQWGLSVAAGGDWNECFAPHPFPKNHWVHLAATCDYRNGLAVYIDGVLANKTPFSHPKPLVAAPNADLVIGRHNKSGTADGDLFATGVLNGLLTDVRLYNGALSAETIRKHSLLYKTEKHPDFSIPLRRFPPDKQRPLYHAMPSAAWTNEPHGLIEWQGRYHLFFQQNANGPYWSQLHWGHLVSDDLVHWNPCPAALAPEAGFDQQGCWSGSALVYNGVPSILYTAVDGQKARICLAQSNGNLIHWTKYAGNPVVAGTPEGLNLMDFRDPFVWVEGDTAYMIIGTAIHDKGGAILLYKSSDLKAWRFVKIVFSGNWAESGTFWEMPILFPLKEKHILMVCEMPGRQSYWIGRWANETFIPDHAAPKRLEAINHFLSPTPLIRKDKSVVLIGISPDTRDPREAWKAGWRHVFGIPRVVTLENGELKQEPLETLTTLRGAHYTRSNIVLTDDSLPILPDITGDSLEIRAVFAVGDAKKIGIRLRCSPDRVEETCLYYDSETHQIVWDRSRSSINPAVRRDLHRGDFTLQRKEPLVLHLFIDRSMIDVFVNGRATFTGRIYPVRSDSNRVGIVCSGKAMLQQLDIWQMNTTHH